MIADRDRIARSHERLKGRQPQLTARRQAELVRMHGISDYTITEQVGPFSVGRAMVYRVLNRVHDQPKSHPEG
ncbi:hypothetical protein [Actinomadura sp. K4S16]|uniref:hypothetical protein n=1 Tax=Actinomadura sp. K4S16 TaxID=1316147 RepID=UPI0011ECCA27|nr:hypothetical protein [Actinomadura sp. K4S16]